MVENERRQSQQSAGPIDQFYRVGMGIITFLERGGPQNKKAKPGVPDMIGVQEIQHGTDGLGGSSLKVMELCNIPCGDHRTADVVHEQVGTDETGTLISPR